MHKTGIFILDSTAFSEKDWGPDTVIYMKLINQLSESRWEAFYSALKTTAEIIEELKEFSRANPDHYLKDRPEDYHTQDSDPVNPGDDTDIDKEY